MAACFKCGADLGPQPPAGGRCPRCGDAQPGVGAPPPFAEDPHGEVPPGSTIFGVPDEQTEPLASRPRAAPSGPPAIDLDDLGAPDDPLSTPHNELDLAELGDLPLPAEVGTGQPHGELDLGQLGEIEDSLDLAPVSAQRAQPSPPAVPPLGVPIPPPPSNPVSRVEVQPPRIPPPPLAPPPRPPVAPRSFDIAAALGEAALSEELDLPAPVQRQGADLPAPAGKRAPPRPPAVPAMGPAARAGVPAAPDFGVHRSPSAPRDLDLELDLPTSAEVDLPLPADTDLPLPADADLPMPAGTDLPVPSASEVRPSGLELSPTGLDLEAAELAVQPATTDLQPHVGGDLPTPVGKAERGSRKATTAGTTPKKVPSAASSASRPGSRRLLILGGGLLVVAVAGAGVVYSGILDPDDVEPTARGVGRTHSKDAAQGAAAAASKRSPAFLAALATDTPGGYTQAIEEGQSAGDPVAEAEASLLLHLRYGPDPVSAGKGSALLQPYAGHEEPHVRRVLGLDALARNKLDEAETLLAGDESRTRLYRGLLRMQQARPSDAMAEADAVLAEHPDDVGVLTLRHTAQLAQDAGDARQAIEESVAKRPDHPALRELAVRAAQASGWLAKARVHAEALVESVGKDDTVSKAYRARIHALQAETLARSGLHGAALAAYGRARELTPDDASIRIAHVRSMVEARELSQAWAEIVAVVQADPSSLEAAVAKAEVSIAAGKIDEAFAVISALQASVPNDARVAYLLGEAHAMNLAIDEAQSAYAAARSHDPLYWRAAVGEARMLAHARRHADAIAVLDAARRAIDDGSHEGSEAKRAGAALMLHKARLLEDAGDFAAAELALDQALEADPNDNDAQLARALLHLRASRQQPGRSDLLSVYERTGGYPGLTGPLGRVFAAERNVEALEALVAEHLDDPEAPTELRLVGARLRLLQGRLGDARGLLEQALTREPNHWEAHLLLAETLLESGDPVAALSQIERVRAPEPNARLHLLRGQILEYNNRHDEARPEYLAALELDPELHEARMWHGRLLALRGANKQAIEELGKVTAQTGDAFPRAWLELGRAQRGLGEHAAALTSLRRASTLDASLHEAFYLEGRLHADQNRHAQAIAAMERAVVDEAKDEWWYANALMDLGRAQAKAGQAKQALSSFEAFLAVAPANHASRAEAKRQVESLRR